MTSSPAESGPGPSPAAPGLAMTIVLYTLARLGIVAVVATVLVVVGVPLAVAVLVGLIVALPLSMVLFRGLRTRLDAAIAETTRRRSRERDALRARLRGDGTDPADADPETADPAGAGPSGPGGRNSGERAQAQPDGTGG